MKLSDVVEYKCVVINSEYSNNFIRIQEGKRHYISGILSNGIIYVLVSQKLREVKKKRRPFIVLKDRVDKKENDAPLLYAISSLKTPSIMGILT